MAGKEYNAVVEQKVEVTSDLMILRIKPKGWALPPFKAGQYTVLGLKSSEPRAELTDVETSVPPPGKLIRRAYSVASSSVDNEYIEFYIALVRSGALTPRLFALHPGRELWLSPRVVGMFTMDEIPPKQNILLIATGTGLAPYMSMLRTHLSQLQNARMAVIHGANHSWDLGYRAELNTMQRLSSAFRYQPIISNPGEENVPWSGAAGFINDFWSSGELEEKIAFRPSPESTHVFLCGNPLMIEGMLPILVGEGFVEHSRKTPGQVHLEKFWVDD